MRRIGLTILIVFQVKNTIDYGIRNAIKFRSLEDHVAIVTGGNSGTGFSVAKHLVASNCYVVIGCRSMEKCNHAVSEIQNIYPGKSGLIRAMHLDLNDLGSVRAFVDEFERHYDRLDYLVNNAGLVASVGTRTKQGLEESFGAMHIGHFALTNWLLKLLTKPIPGKNLAHAAKVINVASAAYVSGNFHPTLFSDTGDGDLRGEITDNCPLYGPFDMISCCPLNACPNTNGYARAKLSNVLHAQELQRRFDEHVNASSHSIFPKHYRRLVTASLHPGTVSTNIAPILKYSPSFTRSSDDGGLVILHAILDDSYVPGSFIDEMLNAHDLVDLRDSNLPAHLSAYPAAQDLPFSKESSIGYFSLHKLVWSLQTFVVPQSAEMLELTARESARLLGARLWDVSDQIVHDWEMKHKILMAPVRQTSRQLRL
jgi:NAD(P)-dependent dehydrogenase (short-subunit alcohol dehydrogenase family)